LECIVRINSLELGNNIVAIKKLSSLLWIPTEDEKEVSLDGARASFKEASFKMSEEDNSSPHAISRIILYTDEVTGITIRYNPSSRFVEAIAKYDVSTRAPAAMDQKKQAPYTFGDESKVSK